MHKPASSDIISRKDIVKVVSIVLSNWYLLLIIPLVAFAAAYLYSYRIPDEYAAKCQILLKSNETYNYQQEIYKGLGFSSRYATYEETASQMRVIKSTTLLEKVLERIPLNVSYFIIGRIKVSELYKHHPFKVVPDERSASGAGIDFNLQIVDLTKFRLQYEMNGEHKERVVEFGQLILDDGLYLRIEKEPNLTEVSLRSLSQIDYMFRVEKNLSLVNRFKSALDVKNIDYTSIVELTFRDRIPERATEVLNALAHIYVESTVANKSEVNENTLVYIDKQLGEVVDIINEIESELESYKDEKAILNLSKEEETYYARLLELENKQRQHELSLTAIEDLTTFLLKNEDVEALLPPSMFIMENDPQLKQYITELYNLRSSYYTSVEVGTESNPTVMAKLERIQDLKDDILYYLDTQKGAVLVSKTEVEKELKVYEAKLKNIPQTQRQLINIERRLAINEELYSFLLSKRAETVIAKAGLVPETKIIESARSVGVVYPDKMKMNLMGVVVGLVLAVAIVVLKEMFFQKITNTGQLQTSTDITILGGIPKKKDFSGNAYSVLAGGGKSNVLQAFRVLRTNLQYLLPSEGSKRILVTSLLPGEGKTFTSINLAGVFAIAEKRTLIIDIDLHKPRVAKALEMDNSKGLSSFLAGQCTMDDIIRKTELPNLDVITSGPVPPNASELILREELRQVFDYADKHYDYVFLDTPPISLITDGIYLMKEVHAKLFVLNSRFTTKASIDFIERLVHENNLENCALLLNEEKITRMNYYYTKYGYGGYGYGGYGYGEYGDSPERT